MLFFHSRTRDMDPSNERCQFVCWTANNYTPDGLRAIKSMGASPKVTRETSLTYLIFQQEEGAQNGTPHLQGYLQMERKVCIKSVTKFLQKILGTPVRTFKTMGTSEEASVYCKKDDTRDPGTETFEGRFTGLTPYQAANKALSKYYREKWRE